MQFCGSVPIQYRARRKRGAARVLGKVNGEAQILTPCKIYTP